MALRLGTFLMRDSMKYIIMCGGNSIHWDSPRQLLKICRETIVERTIRLLRKNGITDIAISSNNPLFENFGVPVLHHDNDYVSAGYNQCKGGHWCDCFYPMDEPACYLHGDVVFSMAAIRTIINTPTDDIIFFGSAPPFSNIYPKPYIEPFAFKVVNQAHLHQAVADVKRLEAEGRFNRQPIAWEVWNVISRGPDGDVNAVDFNSYVHINDYTCDIDHPNEKELFSTLAIAIMEEAGRE